MTNRHIFKIVILTHEVSLYDVLKTSIFGLDFEKSFTQTRGAAFAFSHFILNGARVTSQFWCLDASPQWSSIRNIYMKGASGIILLVDPQKKGAKELTNKLLREFTSVNRYSVPIVVLSYTDGKKNSNSTINYAKEISRWSGFEIPHIDMDDKSDKTDEDLNKFMELARDWRAFNVVSQALKVYFDMDSISNESRQISVITRQLRQIYTSRYYSLIDDHQIGTIITTEAKRYGFKADNNEIRYSKDKLILPFKEEKSSVKTNKSDRPNVKKVD